LIGRFRIDQPNGHQLLRMGKRKPAQCDGINHRELGRSAADAETQHEHRQKKKRFVLPQNAKADSNILPKCI
jgi:hypothetical protein